MQETPVYLTAKQVESAATAYFEKAGCVTVSQVRNGTGYARSTTRTADMLAISTWPSRGLYCDGIEIKVSRGDLRKELSQPEKADEIAQYCHHWWVIGPQKLLTPDMQFPKNWGYMAVDAKLRVKVVKQAASLKPKSMDLLFVCAVMRSFHKQYVSKAWVAELVKQEVTKTTTQNAGYHERQAKTVIENAKQFHTLTGIDLLHNDGCRLRYDLKDVGDCVNQLVELAKTPKEELLSAHKALVRCVAALDVALRPFGHDGNKPS